jgi:hypothetical protein
LIRAVLKRQLGYPINIAKGNQIPRSLLNISEKAFGVKPSKEHNGKTARNTPKESWGEITP